MDSVTLAACHRRAVSVLTRWLTRVEASHVSAHALLPLGAGDEVCLPTRFEKALRELPGACLGEPVTQLSDEQIERATRRATVAVEVELANALVAVQHESHRAVGLDTYGDAETQVVVVEGHAAHRGHR